MKQEYIRQQLHFPDWYLRLEDYLRTQIYPIVHDDPNLQQERHVFYGLVEEMLENRLIPLAESGPNLDACRETIDTVIIHHTEEDADISLDRLSAIGFVRQYGLNYLNDNVWGNSGLKGQPIWSGHFKDGKMVFFAYHWLIRPDGRQERLLEDSYVGRHSLDMNPRSIGIALSGNYEHSMPPLLQIESAGHVIESSYPFIKSDRILGHCEVMEGRTCPGDKFLEGWKKTLVGFVR